MKAKEIMTKKPEFLPPNASLKEASVLMKSHDYGFIPVGENDRLIGALTDRDIAIRAFENGINLQKATVGDLMTKGIEYCFETDDLKEVAKKMESLKLRRLVVLDKDKRMTGIISLGDIVTKCKDHELCWEVADAVSEH